MKRIININEKTYYYNNLKIYDNIKNFQFNDYLTHTIILVTDTDMERQNKRFLYTKYNAYCEVCEIHILHIVYNNDSNDYLYVFNKDKKNMTNDLVLNNKVINCKECKLKQEGIIIKDILE